MAFNRSIFLVMAILLPLVISIRVVNEKERENHFKEGDPIPLFVNTVWYHSCDEYLCSCSHKRPYFEFPFCPPGNKYPIRNRTKTFEEMLAGDCLTPTQYELKFKVGTIRKLLCEKNLTKDEVSKFRYAVRHGFQYSMYHDNISCVDYVGTVNASGTYLFKHTDFYPRYYGNQVKGIYSLSDFGSAVDITEDIEIKVNFTYSVFWKELNINSTVYNWAPREMDFRELLTVILMLPVIWPVLILLWPGLLLAISVSYLKSYFTRYPQGNVRNTTGVVSSQQIPDDAGRRPPYSSLLGAILGIGIQHLIVICSLFLTAYNGVLYPCQQDSVYSRISIVYCFSSVVAGYTATSFHARYCAHGWKECVFQTGALYFVPVVLTIPVIYIGIYTMAVLLHAPLILLSLFVPLRFNIWVIGTVICLSLGGYIGYYFNFESQKHRVTRRTQTQRDIPQQSWWMSTPGQMFLGGLLPFLTIFRDMDGIYASLWNMKVCGAFSSLFTAFLLVIIMTIFVGMCYTCYQLSKQDLQWWWRSVLRGGSTAIYMFAYGIYFDFRSNTNSIYSLEHLIFLGYNACIFYSFFLVLGAIGFFASSAIAHCMQPGQDKHE